jgi:predicted aspartyl protease
MTANDLDGFGHAQSCSGCYSSNCISLRDVRLIRDISAWSKAPDARKLLVMTRFMRSVAAVLGLFCLAWPTGAKAQCLDGEDAVRLRSISMESESAGPIRDDGIGRMVAPLTVNGAGPFRFIVDTGANRSALSQALAERLGLAAVGTGDLHTVHGVAPAQLVEVDSFRYGQLSLGGNNTVPIVQAQVLAGEHGLLGVDGMRDRRLRMDFAHQCIEIGPSDQPMPRRGWTRVQGELRFGHLVVIPGRVGEHDIHILIDTGSNATLANEAFLAQLGSELTVDRRRVEIARGYGAGETATIDRTARIRDLRMGDVQVRGVTAFIGDFHIFRLWELVDEPALLVGMDVLTQTDALVIDYGDASVHFRLRRPVHTGSRLAGGRAGPGMAIGRD